MKVTQEANGYVTELFFDNVKRSMVAQMRFDCSHPSSASIELTSKDEIDMFSRAIVSGRPILVKTTHEFTFHDRTDGTP